MRTYKLSLKDKIYLFFQEDSIKRITYLFPKVKEHQLKWFKEEGIKIPLDFDRYIENYVECLINDYEFRK